MATAHSAFDHLRALLHGIDAPSGLEPIPLQLGESRLGPPAIDVTPLASVVGWTRYPTLGGGAELRAAYGGWLQRRFRVQRGLREGRIAIEPTPGTKQAVATVLALAVGRVRDQGGQAQGRGAPPAVVLPNPFYPTYRAATEASGARPLFYSFDDVPDAAPVARAVVAAEGPLAAVVVCNPGNPRGEVLSAATLREIATIAAAAGAVLVVDECYTDLTCGDAPTGHLALVERNAVEPAPFVVLHSLSKRSAVPGLRSGFAAGDPETVGAYAAYNRQCGVSTAQPVNAVAAALWADEAHVVRAREALARNWDLADAALAHVPHYRRADAGFFLWLPVADDEETARRLWRSQALSVMPGRYLAAEGVDGVNPGAGHLRVALVHQAALMREALARLGAELSPWARQEDPPEGSDHS